MDEDGTAEDGVGGGVEGAGDEGREGDGDEADADQALEGPVVGTVCWVSWWDDSGVVCYIGQSTRYFIPLGCVSYRFPRWSL